MEHAQRATSVRGVLQTPQPVLILILMEHAQRENKNLTFGEATKRLNPYFNGTCSKRR